MPRSLSALVGAVALGGCSFLGIRTVEEPSYTVVDRLGGSIPVEVRRYPPRLAAETVVDARGGTWKAESDAFGILAGFIFGGNRQRQEVAMTAPVEVTVSDKVVGIGSGLRWPPVTRPGVGSGRAWRV
jgi:SOUL heme-binding protein